MQSMNSIYYPPGFTNNERVNAEEEPLDFSGATPGCDR